MEEAALSAIDTIAEKARAVTHYFDLMIPPLLTAITSQKLRQNNMALAFDCMVVLVEEAQKQNISSQHFSRSLLILSSMVSPFFQANNPSLSSLLNFLTSLIESKLNCTPVASSLASFCLHVMGMDENQVSSPLILFSPVFLPKPSYVCSDRN